MGAGETGEGLFFRFPREEKDGCIFPLRFISHTHPCGRAKIRERLQRLPSGGTEEIRMRLCAKEQGGLNDGVLTQCECECFKGGVHGF